MLKSMYNISDILSIINFAEMLFLSKRVLATRKKGDHFSRLFFVKSFHSVNLTSEFSLYQFDVVRFTQQIKLLFQKLFFLSARTIGSRPLYSKSLALHKLRNFWISFVFYRKN